MDQINTTNNRTKLIITKLKEEVIRHRMYQIKSINSRTKLIITKPN